MKTPFYDIGPLPGVVIFHPRVFEDDRGSFFEAYKKSDLAVAGVHETFVQENQSRSEQGVLRGLHFQSGIHAQGKLVRVLFGAIWDVAVDLRPGSATFGQWFGLELNDQTRTMVYWPPGLAHGFLTLSTAAEVLYHCTQEHHSPSEEGVRWDDPELAIAWPRLPVPYVLSARDRGLPGFLDWQKQATPSP